MDRQQFLLKKKKQWFLKSKAKPINDDYEVDTKKVLGPSVYGHVIKAKNKSDQGYYAIKIVPKNKVKNSSRLIQDVNILRAINHPNIVKIFETYEDLRNVYIVMEICEGQTILDQLMEKAHLTEEDCRKLFKQLILAINCCHEYNICHRDLKPQSFVFSSKADTGNLKCIDFGLSMIYVDDMIKKQNNQVVMTTRPGRPFYIAPEVQSGRYGSQCDLWAAGVILYIILTGTPPFSGTDPEIFDDISNLRIKYDTSEFLSVSLEAKDLIQKLLVNEKTRYSAWDVLRHPWILKEKSENSLLSINYLQLKSVIPQNTIKQVVLTFISTQMQEQEIMDLRNSFENVDLDQDGLITIEEMRQALVSITSTQSQDLEQILINIETSEIKTINYLEFMAATMERSLYLREEKLYQVFKMLDGDGSGKISSQELLQVVKEHELFKGIQLEQWTQIVKEADKNGDGEIDYIEFIETVMSKRR